MPQRPGSVSLSPPSNIESTALLSMVVGMLPASACQSMSPTPSAGLETSPTGLSWLPSPPWKLLPASGALVGVSANAEEAPIASNTSAQAAPKAKRVQWFMRVCDLRVTRCEGAHRRLECLRAISETSGHISPAWVKSDNGWVRETGVQFPERRFAVRPTIDA